MNATFATVLSCGAATAAIAQSAGDQERAVAATNAYFEARAQADFETAYGFVSPDLAGFLPRPMAESQWGEQHAAGVDFRSLQITGGAWYQDPEGLPPGLYAAVEFAGESEQVPVTCGFLVWHMASDQPQLNRIELNLIDRATYDQIPAAQLPDLIAQLGC
ncbi:hypothetical protein HKCCE4037_07845 [Rhodobacterales bacterium HKCCE4037]|nr:hypothetical protein [Rhodobacterales bacterium HKCCE4037]